MGIPGALMPGGGGQIPAAGMPAPGAPGPGGPVDETMKLLASLQEQPQPSGEDQMLYQASMMLNAAYARIALRSAKAAKYLATANQNIQSARETLQSEPQAPMAAPPSLGMPDMAGMNPGAMGAF